MLTRTEDQIATVLALRPRGKAQESARTPVTVMRGKRGERPRGDVVELAGRRRPAKPEYYEPQGGDAA
jgi:hypothetical protein